MFLQREQLVEDVHNVTSLKNKFDDQTSFNKKKPPYLSEKPKIASKDAVKIKMNNCLNNTDSFKNDNLDNNFKEPIGLNSNLVNQLKCKVKKKNFTFTMMIVGESGLGKSTLINQLFNCEIYNQDNPGPSFKPCKTTKIDINRIHLIENNVNLYLNLIDTPGFGNFLDNTNCCDEIMDFIEKKFDEYLVEEIKFGKKQKNDFRVHCCLYFIQPTGHSLKQLDIELMNKLSNKVNLVPIIAKADTLTSDELKEFKKNVLNDIKKNSIDIYDFPDYSEFNFNTDEIKEQNFYKSLVPFAIISSNKLSFDDDGNKKRVRKYPWGEIDVENLEYSDFIAMKKLIIKYNLLDMIERTNRVFYETYRTEKLNSIEESSSSKPKSQLYQRTLTNTLMVFWNPLSQFDEERKEFEEKMVKMKSEMEKVFESKVEKKIKNLEEIKAELENKEKIMKEVSKSLFENLKSKREKLEKEKEAFYLVKKEMDEMIIANQENNKDLLIESKKKEKKKGLF